MDALRRPRLLLGLGLLALVVRIAFFAGGVRGSDAYAYAQHAWNLATGRYDLRGDSQYYGFRWTVLLPTAAAYRLLGPGDFISTLAPLGASLATLGLLGRLGRLWLGPEVAGLAALLWVVIPLDVVHATLLGPSSFLPCLSTAAVLVGWQARAARGPRALALAVLSGILVGLAAGARETGILLVLPLGFFVATARPAGRAVGLGGGAAVGVASVLGLEALAYWRWTGDPLFRLTVVSRLSEPFTAGPDPEGVVAWTYYPRGLLGLEREGLASFGLVPHLALAGSLLGLGRRDRRLLPLAAWLVPVLGYLEFGSMSPLSYLPLLKHYNYLSLVLVPLVLLAAYALAGLAGAGGESPRPWRRNVVGGLLAVVAVTSLYGAWRIERNLEDDARPYQAVARRVEAEPDRPIWVVHERWALFLNYLLGFRTGFDFYGAPPGRGTGRLRYLWEVEDPRELGRAFVVLHDRYLAWDTRGRWRGRIERLPAWVYGPPPEGWRLILDEPGRPPYNRVRLYATEVRP